MSLGMTWYHDKTEVLGQIPGPTTTIYKGRPHTHTQWCFSVNPINHHHFYNSNYYYYYCYFYRPIVMKNMHGFAFPSSINTITVQLLQLLLPQDHGQSNHYNNATITVHVSTSTHTSFFSTSAVLGSTSNSCMILTAVGKRSFRPKTHTQKRMRKRG